MTGFAGKTVFLTGAARGQGRAHAVAFARGGADLALLDVCRDLGYPRYALATRADLAETARLVEAEGRRAVPLVADVRDFDAMGRAVAEAIAALGHVDVLVCNAGITDMCCTWDLPEAWWDTTIDVNLKGCFTAVRHVLPHMVARGRGGRVILVSSTAGQRGLAGLAHYAAAKFGVVGFAKSLALEAAPHGITVNTVHPTAIDTPLLRGMAEAASLDVADLVARATRDNVLADTPLPPEEVSHAVLWLASDEARFVTGQEMNVDAGRLLR